MRKFLQGRAYPYLQAALFLGLFYSLTYGYLFTGIALIFAINGMVAVKYGLKGFDQQHK